MKRIVVILCMFALAGGLFWFFPLFRVVRVENASAAEKQLSFDAAQFAESFWRQQLVPALGEATDAGAVLAELHESPQAARGHFGRKVGLSRTRILILQGHGTIVTVEKDGVGVSLDDGTVKPDVMLQTALLFGNTVRDATGLLNAGDFTHSQDFNDISTQLNRIVEERVITSLKETAEVGRQLRFVGCVEISDAASVPQPLPLIPLKVIGE